MGRSAANSNAIRSQQNLSNKTPSSGTPALNTPTPGGAAPATPPPVITQTQNPGAGYNPSMQQQPNYQTYNHNNNGSSFWSNAFWFMLGRSTASHASPSPTTTGTGGADGSAVATSAGGAGEATPFWAKLLAFITMVVFAVIVFKITRAIWRTLFSRSPKAADAGNGVQSNYSLK
ncbi:hypothetical protein [Uliginosibacterium gangwonense]|uniref:hypothetical protein n=1 Tax=Uliginosibacterium gangwonense TaxID=392736 RepID=UPI00036A53C8|nr:hypothetical protein [Uliginosibacterium gangwonense]